MLLAVLATALGVTICSKWFADRAARNATLDQLSSTGRLCVNAKYPLTENVLTQIQELSSLKLAIVDRDGDAYRYESRSSGFPDVLGLDRIGNLAAEAATSNGRPFLASVKLGDGMTANASAFPLPIALPSRSSRFLILVQEQSRANATSVQAFVLPLVTGLCSSIAIALVAALVASKIGKRIERLGSHVKRIANGSFDKISPTGPPDVIRSLYESVNSMSVQLRESSAQIAQNERSRMINLMASGLAHELRNHLTGARLAIQTCSPDPNTREALTIALKQMQLAEESIQRLLTLRVDTADKWTPSMSIQMIYESVRDLVLPIASHQRVAFVMSEPSEREKSIDDGSSVVGALINLVLNALEAAGPGGKVVVSTTLHDDAFQTVEWSVRDTGPGPSKEMQAIMFEPFATTKREGVGLGLAMCKRIAQRQEGDVNWHRESDFTVFTMHIRTIRSKE